MATKTTSAKKRKSGKPSIMEELRAIRDKMSREVMNMTFEEQRAYYAAGSKWFTDKMEMAHPVPNGQPTTRQAKREPLLTVRSRKGVARIRKSVANSKRSTARKAK